MCIALNKGLNMIKESIVDPGSTKTWSFFQEIRSTEFEALNNIVYAQPEKDGKDFDTTDDLAIWSPGWVIICNLSILPRLKLARKAQSDAIQGENRV